MLRVEIDVEKCGSSVGGGASCPKTSIGERRGWADASAAEARPAASNPENSA
jgi:hypothetical protein